MTHSQEAEHSPQVKSQEWLKIFQQDFFSSGKKNSHWFSLLSVKRTFYICLFCNRCLFSMENIFCWKNKMLFVNQNISSIQLKTQTSHSEMSKHMNPMTHPDSSAVREILVHNVQCSLGGKPSLLVRRVSGNVSRLGSAEEHNWMSCAPKWNFSFWFDKLKCIDVARPDLNWNIVSVFPAGPLQVKAFVWFWVF